MPTKKELEKIQLEKIMKNLGLSEEEAKDVMRTDKLIDTDNSCKLFELTGEQKAASKAATITTGKTKKVDAYGKKTTRERKPNEDRRLLIEILKNAVIEGGAEISSVENPEQKFEFYYNGVRYRIVMSCPKK